MKQQPETLSYETAYAELQQIVHDLQGELIGIDELAAKIKRARDLIAFCRERLRQTEEAVVKITG